MKPKGTASEDSALDASANQQKTQPETEEESAEASHSEEPLFAIVGVGASAGGLEAFTELLKHLPMDTGMGFVVIQHLAPKHHSMLTQLLARATRLPVTEVTEGMVVEPNHIYVIPPNAEMAIVNGALRLMPRPPGSGPPLPIDSFLASLAADRGNQAIGIILSGSASDGTLGLKAIKANGGFTFAQDESAKYDSMPRSAIAAGYVDYVLPPSAIAKELARISQHPYIGPAKPAATGKAARLPEDDLAKVFVWLRSLTGVDFNHYKRATIIRRIRRRMVLHNMDALGDYVRYLKGNREELDALYGDILINVTSFFREPESFEILKKEIFPQLMNNRPPKSPLRIWVPACSTGEEPYSIAICAAEFLREVRSDVAPQIFATDISQAALDKARAGTYTVADVSEVGAERLGQFFASVDGGYQVIKSIREACVFARQNVIKDPPFSRLDLISCRNLLIYLDASMQAKLIPVFHYALRPGGFLVLGKSESISEFSELFTVVDKKHRVYAKKARPLEARAIAGLEHFEPEKSYGIVAPDASPLKPDLQKEIQRTLLDDYTPPAVVVNQDLEIVQFHGHTGPYLDPAPGAASLRLLKMAREGLALDLRAAIYQAQQENQTILKKGLRIRSGADAHEISLEVRPLKLAASRDPYFLVLFREPASEPVPTSQQGEEGPGEVQARDLAAELHQTRVQLQALLEQYESRNEELQAANEEIESSNEEMQSTNEELETAKEELQAANEELTTLNDELQNRNQALGVFNDDLINVINNVTTPMVIVDGDLRIRRFTPAAAKVLSLIAADVGRSILDLRSALDLPGLEAMVRGAAETMGTHENEVKDRQGRWHSLRVRPYRTSDNRIDGSILTLVDIDELKGQATEARAYAQSIVETVREPMLVLDADLKIRAANRAFYETFEVSPADTLDRRLEELGQGPWNIPPLLALLNDILPRETLVKDYEVEHDFPTIGHRIMLLNALQIRQGANQPRMILLAIQDVTERERVAKALQLQSWLIELAHDAIIVRDAEDRVVSWNQGADILYGWSKEEALGQVTHALFKTVFPGPSEDVQRTLETEGVWAGELIHTTSTGRQITVASRQILKRDADGRPQAVLEINRDITERTRAEATLRESEERFRTFLDNTLNPVFIKDIEGRYLLVNEAFRKLVGKGNDEIRAKPDSDLFPPEEAAAFRAHDLSVIEAGKGVEFEETTEQPDGLHISLVQKFPLRDREGKIYATGGIATDITARRETVIALKKSEERFRLLVEGVRDYAIFALDTEGRVETWNAGAARINGYGAEEIVGRLFSIFYPAEDIESGKPDRLLKIAAAEGRVEDEGWRVRKDGSRFLASVLISAVHDEAGNLLGFTKIVRDITDRKRSEEAIRELSGRLLRIQDDERRRIARDLHDSTAQILSGLALNLSLVESRPSLAKDGRALKAVKEAQEMAKRAGAEIRDLSHLLHPPDLDTIGLVAAIDWYTARFNNRSGVAVELELPDNLRRLPQDIEIALFRVVQESLTNVHRHSGSQTARVRITHDDHEVTLEIADRGRGLPEGVLDPREGNLLPGVGVAGMRERVKQLGGKLEIASADGQGTTVKVTVPCSPETA